jgi:PAS domain S-box-containing protein
MSFVKSIARPSGPSLRGRILLLFAGIAFALLAVAGLVIHQATAGARAWAEAEMLGSARDMAQIVDSRFAAAEALLMGLAASRALQSGALEAFAAEIAEAAGTTRLGIIGLATPDGSQLLNSMLGPDYRMPPGTPANPAARRAFISGHTEISNLYTGPVSGEPQVVIAVPIRCPEAEGRWPVCYALSIALRSVDFARTLAGQNPPPGWIAALLDREGRVVARTERHLEFVGSAPVPAMRAVIDAGQDAAVITALRHDGVTSIVGLVRARASGFRVALAAPDRQLTGPLQESLRWALVAGGAITLAGMLLALLLARRIDRGVRWLGTLGSQQPAALSPGVGISEIDNAGWSLREAAASRDSAQAALRAREAGFRAAFEAPIIGMAQADPETGALLMVNQRFREITGQAEAALLSGASVFTLVEPEAAEAHRQALRTAGGYSTEGRCMRPDGSIAWVHLSVALIQDPAVAPPRAVAVLEDVTAQHSLEQRQTLITRELAHRARNALTVVQAAVRLTPRTDPAAFAAAVEARVAALARAHALLAREGWTGADLRMLVEGELAPFLPEAAPDADSGRTSLEGPPIALQPEAVQPLAMAMHELCTNSTKHGALSAPDGRVGVRWSVDATASRLRIVWAETGGPLVAPPTRRGFGSRLLEATVQGQLGGAVERSWPRSGLVCVIDIPLERVVAGPP